MLIMQVTGSTMVTIFRRGEEVIMVEEGKMCHSNVVEGFGMVAKYQDQT